MGTYLQAKGKDFGKRVMNEVALGVDEMVYDLELPRLGY